MSVKPLTSKKHVKMFMSTVNFIKNHKPNRSKLMEPLTRLTKERVKFEWKEEQQKAFDAIKAKCSEAIMLVYPKINEPFHLYKDACHVQIGGVMTQDNKVLAVCSTKLDEAPRKHQITEKELLAID